MTVKLLELTAENRKLVVLVGMPLWSCYWRVVSNKSLLRLSCKQSTCLVERVMLLLVASCHLPETAASYFTGKSMSRLVIVLNPANMPPHNVIRSQNNGSHAQNTLNIYNPIPSMYGIFPYIYHKNEPNVGKYTIHGWYG